MQISRDITGGQCVRYGGSSYHVYQYVPASGVPAERVFLVPLDGGAVISAPSAEIDATAAGDGIAA